MGSLISYLFHIIADGNLKDYLTMLAMIPWFFNIHKLVA